MVFVTMEPLQDMFHCGITSASTPLVLLSRLFPITAKFSRAGDIHSLTPFSPACITLSLGLPCACYYLLDTISVGQRVINIWCGKSLNCVYYHNGENKCTFPDQNCEVARPNRVKGTIRHAHGRVYTRVHNRYLTPRQDPAEVFFKFLCT